MQKRILLDGCSFTYGLNLSREETLEHHFIESGYEVLNLSRPGKSNHAISFDIYNQIDCCDIVVAGWTFSSRWHLRYYQKDIDLLANRKVIELPNEIDSGLIENSYQDLHKSLYSLFDITYWNRISDKLVDTTAAYAQQRGKNAIFFSWEPRQVHSKIYYPHVPQKHRLPCSHLNADGTRNLFEKLTNLIEQQ
jgi:hypothetical protein